MNSPGVSFYTKGFWLAVAIVMAYAVARIFTPFFSALTWAAFLAFLLHPINLRLRRRLRGNSAGAAGVLTLLAPIIVLLPLAALSIDFVAQVSALLFRIETAAKRFDFHSLNDAAQFPWIAHASLWLQAHMPMSTDQIQGWAIGGIRETLQRAATFGGSVFLGTMSTVVGFVITLFLLFFFLRDGEMIAARARRLIPLDELKKERLIRRMSDLTRAIVFGTSITAFLQGLMVGIGFAIAGLPSPVVFGVLAALLALLPVGGTALVWIPGSIWLCIDHRWGYGIFLLVWGTMLGVLDNVLRPMLISGRASISTLVVFIGVLGGISVFGAIGIIAGPLVLSLALALLQFTEESPP